MNSDIVYILCFIIVILNCIIFKKKTFPKYINAVEFKLIYLLSLLVIINYDLYIGTFLGITYLSIMTKINELK